MKTLFIGALALLAGTGMANRAAAQAVRAEARIRVSDGVVVGVSVGQPYVYRGVVVRSRRPVGRRYTPAYWRALERRHELWHRAMEREHDRMVAALARGRITVRQYRVWLRATDRKHDQLFGVLGHRYEDRRWDNPRDRRPRGERYDDRRGRARRGRPHN